MARVLVVDDDTDQTDLRRLILERAGHQVWTASNAEEAAATLEQRNPDTVIMDLRLPRAADGLALIHRLRAASPSLSIIVVSGWTAELERLPEASMVNHVLQKPVRSERLLGLLEKLGVFLLLLAAPAVWANAGHEFTLKSAAEAVAELEMSSSGSDWGRPGSEAALADLNVDGRPAGNVMLFAGAAAHRYTVFLGRLAAGTHRLEVSRNAAYSAPGSGLSVHRIQIREYTPADPLYPVMAHAPVIHARPNTLGRFTDVPILAYCEREGRYLQYTVVFSNEDGGTSTRALMARWGRTTDIEHVYRVWLDDQGRPARATIQTKGHRDVDFTGRRDASHPLLHVSTDNNMVDLHGEAPIRYQMAPLVADLSGASREKMMDELPWTYRIAAVELEREGKLRAYGTVDGQKISDPRNYLYIEARIANRDSRMAARLRLEGENRWRSSHLGRADYAIERGGWIRTTVELPPGAGAAQVAEIGFECLVEPPTRDKPSPVAGACQLLEVSKVFFLGRDYQPGESFWRLPAEGRVIPTGETLVWRLR